MLIIGAKGHAKELLDVIRQDYASLPLFFFDDISTDAPNDLYGHAILKTIAAAQDVFKTDGHFTLGIGGVQIRYQLFKKFIEMNGEPISIISSRSYISRDATIGTGSTTMPFSSVSNNVLAGKALLLNAYASIHHDSVVGDFVEIAPGARILGGCTIGSFTFIGTNTTVLPHIQIGANVIVAAGAVVTKNVPDNTMVAGNPAVIKKQLTPFNL